MFLLENCLGFYGFLHCWLNAFAEMLRFADRMFYKVERRVSCSRDYFSSRIGGMQLHLQLITERGMSLCMIGCIHMFIEKFSL